MNEWILFDLFCTSIDTFAGFSTISSQFVTILVTLKQVVCQAGIFHGGKALCETQKTRAVVVSSDGVAQWDQELTFPIKVYNLPRMSRVCFGVYEITKSKGKRRGKDANKVKLFTNDYTHYNKVLMQFRSSTVTGTCTAPHKSTHFFLALAIYLILWTLRISFYWLKNIAVFLISCHVNKKKGKLWKNLELQLERCTFSHYLTDISSYKHFHWHLVNESACNLNC